MTYCRESSPMKRRVEWLVLALALMVSVALGQAITPAPEPPSGWTPKKAVVSRHDMVAAANPLAVDAGYQMLRQGGSAVDAAIAVQMVLNLVEPHSSGIGGRAFLPYHTGRTRKHIAY